MARTSSSRTRALCRIDSRRSSRDDARIRLSRPFPVGLAVVVAAGALGGAAPPLALLALPDSAPKAAAQPLAFEARDGGFFVRGGRYNALLRPTGQLVALRAPS